MSQTYEPDLFASWATKMTVGAHLFASNSEPGKIRSELAQPSFQGDICLFLPLIKNENLHGCLKKYREEKK